jgi:hypothetical protein
MKANFYIVFLVLTSMNLMAQEESIINSDKKKVIDFPEVELSIQDGIKYSDDKETNSASELLINPLSENLSYAEIMAEVPNFDPNCTCPLTNYKIGFLMRKLLQSESEE